MNGAIAPPKVAQWFFLFMREWQTLDQVAVTAFVGDVLIVATFVMTIPLLIFGGKGLHTDIYGIWVGGALSLKGINYLAFGTKRKTSAEYLAGQAQLPPNPMPSMVTTVTKDATAIVTKTVDASQ